MIKNIFFPTLLFVILSFSNANAQQVVKMTPGGIGFLQYLPQGYNTNTNKYPLVISLHGIKEKGNTAADVNKVANVGLPKYVKYGAQYPFILVSPQLKTTMGRWSGDYVMQVINYVKNTLRVNPNKVYITGLSLGGGGVLTVAAENPNVFAAILPICAAYNVLGGAAGMAASDLPVWGFHGDADNVVGESVTIKMINAINVYKPSPLAKLTIFPSLGHVIWDRVYKQTNALSWMLSYTNGSSSSSGSSTTTENKVPVANAGGDKTITLPSNAVSISGSASDPDGTISSYAWTKVAGGASSMSGTGTATLKVSGMVQGTYRFKLTVKDNKGAVDTDEVAVIVKAASTTNVLPVANAGADKIVLLPTTSTSIRGSARDNDGTISSYKWTKVSGGTVSLYGTTTTTLKLSSLQSGIYVFRLTVKDNKGATDTDDIKVIVNRPPVAKAGSDRYITLPYGSLTLSGSATDSDGTVVSYLWSKYSGPNLTLGNKTGKNPTLSGFYPGTYILKLHVKDNYGTSGYDYVKIVVKDGTISSN